MQTTQTSLNENSNAPTFETVWALLKEVAENQKETDRQLKESRKETDRQLKESREETDRQMREAKQRMKEAEQHTKKKNDEFYENLGHLTNLFGHLTVGMVAPMLRKKFEDFGYIFQRSNTNVLVDDYVNDIHFEMDVILENSDKAVLVEVKTKLTSARILKHIERLEKMRKYANLHGDKRRFLGAVAGFSIPDELKAYASDEGLFVIEPSGEDFNITPPEGNPREW